MQDMNHNNQSHPDSDGPSDASLPIPSIGPITIPSITPQLLAYVQQLHYLQQTQSATAPTVTAAAASAASSESESLTTASTNTNPPNTSVHPPNTSVHPPNTSVHPTLNATQNNMLHNDTNTNIEQNCNDGVDDGAVIAAYVSNIADTLPPPFVEGQIMPLEEFDNTMMTYGIQMKYELRRETSNSKAANPEYNNKYIKWLCCRARKPPPNMPSERPNRTSYKVNCNMYARGCHPMLDDKSGRDTTKVKIVSFNFEHTGGCTGCDQLVNKQIRRRRGRNYSDIALAHLSKEVRAGRYSTHDVKSWLFEQGMKDVTLEEATNLRYRILKNMTIKGWDFADADKDNMAVMEDFLFNNDLAREIKTGGAESINNLKLLLGGLTNEVEGFDYRITTDSENRFSGAAWQTGRMRHRLKKYGVFIFLDDSRSGINTSGFCFWNVVIIDHDGKVQTVMGAMTMTASNEAVKWILSSMVSMCPEAETTVKGTMSDLGVMEEPVKEVLPNVEYCAACTWHIMTIDFPNNLGHVQGYEDIKSFVYDKLVHDTIDVYQWESYLAEACQTWPAAANYLNQLARHKHRWGAPWRLRHFTLGYEASCPVEGSFSAFKRALGDGPSSFVGVIQAHVKKDVEKTDNEGRELINAQIRAHDGNLTSQRSDPANQCGKVFSAYITNNFEKTNSDSQNYESEQIQPSDDQTRRGVTKVHSVKRRMVANSDEPPPPRIVEEFNGVNLCSCWKDRNKGQPCPHIQCVLGGAFVKEQFSTHWETPTGIIKDARVPRQDNVPNQDKEINDLMDTNMQDNAEGWFEASADAYIPNDGVGVFALPLAQATMPSNDVSEQVRRPPTRKKKLDSTQKFTVLMQEAKQLSGIASQDKEDIYNKTLSVLRWMRTNIQNLSGKELIAAAADYMGIERSATNEIILPPVSQRTAGATSNKRKRSTVESVSFASGKVKCCRFCSEAHTIAGCTAAKVFGKRLTLKTWDSIRSVPNLVEQMPTREDRVVPSDAQILQIIGRIQTQSLTLYKGQVILPGLSEKNGPPSWLQENVIHTWANGGKSSAKYVFVLKKDNAEIEPKVTAAL